MRQLSPTLESHLSTTSPHPSTPLHTFPCRCLFLGSRADSSTCVDRGQPIPLSEQPGHSAIFVAAIQLARGTTRRVPATLTTQPALLWWAPPLDDLSAKGDFYLKVSCT